MNFCYIESNSFYASNSHHFYLFHLVKEIIYDLSLELNQNSYIIIFLVKSCIIFCNCEKTM